MSKWLSAISQKMSIFLLTDLTDIKIVIALLRKLNCDTIQIQGKMDVETIIELASKARDYKYKVVKSVAAPKSMGELAKIDMYIEPIQPFLDAILIDSSWRGGTGKSPNWSGVKKLIQNIDIPVILAGGISESNLLSICNDLTPYGLDVESSVESVLYSNGTRISVKNPISIQRLLGLLRSN